VPEANNLELFLKKLEQLFILLRKETKNKSVYIAGDFNIDILNNCKNKRDRNNFLNLLISYGYIYYSEAPTRITLKSETCIDNIIFNRGKDLSKYLNIELGLSDHRALFILNECGMQTEPNNRNIYKKRMFNNKSILRFLEELKTSSWNITTRNSVQENFDNFLQRFKLGFQQCFPLKC